MSKGCKFTVAKRQPGLFPVDEGPTLFERETDQSFNFSSEGYAQAIRAGEEISRREDGEVDVKLTCAKGSAALAYCQRGQCKVDASGTRSTERLAGSQRKPKTRPPVDRPGPGPMVDRPMRPRGERTYNCDEIEGRFEEETVTRNDPHAGGTERAVATDAAHHWLEAGKSMRCPWALHTHMGPTGDLNGK
jgi:hypothetical protein